MIAYNKLWAMLALHGMNKGDLKTALKCSNDTITAMSKNQYVNLKTIDKICKLFNCQPGDILEYKNSEKTEKNS